MKQFSEMSESEREAFAVSLDFTGEEPLAVESAFKDGRSYDWDPTLRSTVECTPDGRRFVVALRDGKLIRVRELIPQRPAIAV